MSKIIAPKLGTSDYLEWLKRQGARIEALKLKAPVRVKKIKLKLKETP